MSGSRSGDTGVNRNSQSSQSSQNGRGFTLIELVIVVAIIAILVAIAYPSYSAYITKSHRRAAEACLMEYSNYMERFYTTNMRYDQDASGAPIVLPQLDCAAASQTGDSYAYTLGADLAQSAYTVQATPIGSQATLDTACAVMSINQAGARMASGPSGPTGCW